LVDVWIDGACAGNPGKMGIGIVIRCKDEIIKYSISLGNGTNNLAEYYALFIALSELKHLHIKSAHLYSDSILLVKQINGEYKVRDENIKKLYIKIKHLLTPSMILRWIPREENKDADYLAKRAIKLSELVDSNGQVEGCIYI
jgi:ribonuclease HI